MTDKKPFTEQERKVIDLLTEAHNAFCQLPAIDNAEATDWSYSVRALQARICMRQIRRDYPTEFK